MSSIINFFKAIPGLIWDALTWLLQSLGDVIGFMFFTIYDGILTVIYSFSAALDFSAVMFNMAAQYSSMPPQLIWLINQIGLPQGLAYIVGALTIRLLLNLIPAALTRI